MVSYVCTETRLSKSEIMAEINRTKKEMDIEIEAAAILIGHKQGVDMSGFIKEADRAILERGRSG